jgi:hypothetical protein
MRLARRFAAVTAAAALIVAGAITSSVVLAPPAQAATVSGIQMDQFDADLLNLINKERSARGLRALTVHGGLVDGSRKWSTTMAAKPGLWHDPSSWAAAAGCSGWGEIVQYNWTTPAGFLNLYKGSAPHWKIITTSTYRYVGIGTVDRLVNGTRTRYNTVRFAATCTSKPSTSSPWSLTATTPKSGSTSTIGSFEAIDRRVTATTTGAGVSATLVAPVFTTSDDPIRATVKTTTTSPTGGAGLMIRQATNYGAVSTMTIKVAHSSTGKTLPVDVYVIDQWTGMWKVATVMATSVPTSYTVTVPSTAKKYANHVRLTVPGSALKGLSPSLASQRTTLAVYSVTVTG